MACKTYTFPGNDRRLESLRLEAGDLGAAVLVTRFDGAERQIACGAGTWKPGRAAWGKLPEQPIAAAGGWTAADTCTAKLAFTETPFVVTVRLTFADGEVKVESEANLGFGVTKEPPLVGKAE